jgi:hypothetical protein
MVYIAVPIFYIFYSQSKKAYSPSAAGVRLKSIVNPSLVVYIRTSHGTFLVKQHGGFYSSLEQRQGEPLFFFLG